MLGMDYVLGADGTDRQIDCIHLCLYALDEFEIKRPALNVNWYKTSALTHLRALRKWGKKVERPTYNGDILWCGGIAPTFAVVWDTGVLHINNQSEKVHWCPVDRISNYRTFRCSHTSDS